MIDIIEQELRANEDREIALAKRDERIDDATLESLTTIGAVDMMNALSEIDVEAVYQGKFKPGSADDLFHSLMLFIRHEAQSQQAHGAISTGTKSVLFHLVFKNHRDLEIEPIWENEE